MCVDASPSQLVSKVRPPLSVAPGQPVRYADEYRREGIGNVLMFVEPRQGWRPVKVPDRRTTHDVAHWMSDLVDLHVLPSLRSGRMRELSSELLVSPPLRYGENQEFEQMPLRGTAQLAH